ncbi:hypothetical protein GCM10023342_01550 [Modicisalibacter zincidurans]|uniref:Uncharacterized protein n=1 Tax=Modicisalibacter zincidurans TaxID=1178777 RepID=A0ABP9QYH2_9GAMM
MVLVEPSTAARTVEIGRKALPRTLVAFRKSRRFIVLFPGTRWVMHRVYGARITSPKLGFSIGAMVPGSIPLTNSC